MPRPGARPVWRLVGPAFASSVGAFLLTVAAGPEWTAMRRDMGLSMSVAWSFVAYLLPAAVGAAVGALVGRRWPAAVALPAAALLVPGALLTAFASGSGALLFVRASTGFAAGLAWGVTVVLVAQVGPRRVWVAPLVGGVVVLGLVLGPVVGALLERAVGWRWPFLLAVPFGLVALLATAISEIVVVVKRAYRPARSPARPFAGR